MKKYPILVLCMTFVLSPGSFAAETAELIVTVKNPSCSSCLKEFRNTLKPLAFVGDKAKREGDNAVIIPLKESEMLELRGLRSALERSGYQSERLDWTMRGNLIVDVEKEQCTFRNLSSGQSFQMTHLMFCDIGAEEDTLVEIDFYLNQYDLNKLTEPPYPILIKSARAAE